MTINGSHTIGELRDLLNSYTYQQGELESAAAAARAAWESSLPAFAPESYASWKRDYDAWNARYQPVRSRANTVLAATATILQNLETDEPTYQALAAAFAPMAELDRRMRAAPADVAALAPTYPNNPQPTAPDADHGAFASIDAGTRAMPDPVKAIVATIAPGLVPQNADQGNYKSLASNPWVWVGAGAAVLLLLVVVRR